MYQYYGELLPLKLLDEAAFWKHQEKEHTVVIRQIAPNLEQEYVKALEQWEQEFAKTEGLIVRLREAVIREKGYVDPKTAMEIMELIKFCNEQSKKFIQLLDVILRNSQAIKGNLIAVTVIRHIIRESEYFIGITQAILNG